MSIGYCQECNSEIEGVYDALCPICWRRRALEAESAKDTAQEQNRLALGAIQAFEGNMDLANYSVSDHVQRVVTERDRYRTALQRIAAGDRDGIAGDYAREVLDNTEGEDSEVGEAE